MKSFEALPPVARAFGAGVLLCLPAITPALAATGEDPIGTRGMLLTGSLVLLGIGLALKAWSIREERHAAPSQHAADLRWWKNP